MHAPRQEITGATTAPEGRITSKCKRVWVVNGTSYARWSRVADAVIRAIRAVQEIRLEGSFPADADTMRVFHDCAADGSPQANTP